MKILLVEDELDLNNIIVRYLKKNNFAVDAAFNGKEALDFLELADYDLIILDYMMPVMDGMTFLSEIRGGNIATPVLMLTARDSLNDRVEGLDRGADDYLVKPFEFEELVARIRALIRRSYGSKMTSEIILDDLVLDTAKKSVKRAGQDIDLTGKEYEVLEYLMHNQGKVVSREQILNSVWDYDYEGASNIIDVIIKNIRKKIDLGDSKTLIHTKRGLGYVLKED